ncbi:MAG: hypothetical protein GYA21_08880 [Myxococcales bacterium]|nr:hypothetical protein [Myxococcales bacterium]
MKRTMLSVLLLCAGCGGGSDLDRDEVTNIPPGNATGTAASGLYTFDLYVSKCSGTCPLVNVGLSTLSTCDVGFRDEAEVTLTQSDGRIQIDSQDLLVTRMVGGLNADGSFDVGGYGTQLSGAIEITNRAKGILAQDGSVTAQSRTHAEGNVNGTTVDCTATYDVTGHKL